MLEAEGGDVLPWSQPIAERGLAQERTTLVQKVTMQDLAAELGVSRSTVSRALRDDPQISAPMRQRVKALASRLEYRPNATARALYRQRAGAVGLLLPRSSHFVFANPYFSELLSGVSEVAEAAGYALMVSASPSPDYEGWLRGGRVDGLITLGSTIRPDEVASLNRLVESGYPLVVIHAAPAGLKAAVIGSDERGGVLQALEHLAGLGHRRVAFLAGPEGSRYAERRLEAYWLGVERYGLEPDHRLCLPGDDTLKSGMERARQLLNAKLLFTALIGNNDLIALGASRALQAAGLEVPSDVSVVGFDDVPLAALTDPPLTTVRQPVRELGERAMRTLLAALHDKGPAHERVCLPTTLVVRSSTGAAREVKAFA